VCPAPEIGIRTVLFTDIVGSTALQAGLGDCGWRDLLLAHNRLVRSALVRWNGVENDTAGDGFYATFDDAGHAVRCALDVVDDVQPLGIRIRAGLHRGDCELAEDKCSGLTVSIGARVAALADPSQALASEAVRVAVHDEAVTFDVAGEVDLRGVPGRWQLFAARRAG
jgi:class 3 adenylate cyclase